MRQKPHTWHNKKETPPIWPGLLLLLRGQRYGFILGFASKKRDFYFFVTYPFSPIFAPIFSSYQFPPILIVYHLLRRFLFAFFLFERYRQSRNRRHAKRAFYRSVATAFRPVLLAALLLHRCKQGLRVYPRQIIVGVIDIIPRHIRVRLSRKQALVYTRHIRQSYP